MKKIIAKGLKGVRNLTLPQLKFMTHIFLLFVSLKGRINFTTMGRYGSYNEKSYRMNFTIPFNFAQFNTGLIESRVPEKRRFILAADCSYIPKSGKKTDNLGMFWSGSHSRALKGLEISTIAAIDLEKNSPYHIVTDLTPPCDNCSKTRTEFYLQQIIKYKYTLSRLSVYLVLDGYYTKKPFVDGVIENTSFYMISKMRKDANLRYYYKGKREKGKRGRNRIYDGKIICTNPDLRRFHKCYDDEEYLVYCANVYSVSLKRKVRIIYVINREDGKYVILYSTDLNLGGEEIWKMYKARFQIEFLFRDAKQYTGLIHSQSRDKKKLEFHFNTSLTAVSLARMEQEDRGLADEPFSMASVNSKYNNELLLSRFCAMSGIDMSDEKIQQAYESTVNWGKIAA